MKRTHRAVLAALLVLGLAAVWGVRPGRTQEGPGGEVALGVASARRSADRVAAMFQEAVDRNGKRVGTITVDELEYYGPEVIRSYEQLKVPSEVVAIQTALLAADRVSAETAVVDGLGLLKERAAMGFGVSGAELERMHAEKLAWSEVALAVAIARATDKKADDLIAQAKQGKTWPEIAVGAGLQAGKLTDVVKPMFQG